MGIWRLDAVTAALCAAALVLPSHGQLDNVLNAVLAFGAVWFAILAVRQ